PKCCEYQHPRCILSSGSRCRTRIIRQRDRCGNWATYRSAGMVSTDRNRRSRSTLYKSINWKLLSSAFIWQIQYCHHSTLLSDEDIHSIRGYRRGVDKARGEDGYSMINDH